MWPFKTKEKSNPASASKFTDSLVKPLAAEDAGPRREAHTGVLGIVGTPYTVSAEPQEKVIACMVTHGMGQQVPFETLGELAESLVQGMEDVQPVVNRVVLAKDEEPVSRIEIYLAGEPGKPNIRLHIYEGYWAPLTEGKVTFLEASTFLLGGAASGLMSSFRRKKFERWVFGEMREFSIKPGTFSDLIVTLLFLLVGLGLASLLEGKLHAAFDAVKAWSKLHPNPVSYVWASLGDCWTGLMAWIGLLFHHPAAAVTAVGQLLLSAFAVIRHSFWGVVVLAVSGVYVYFFHYFMVQFVGDVAIYISSHKVSKFEEVRTAIQKRIFNVGRQIYSATRDFSGKKMYDRMILVGHSLGSVITYDLLNEMIAWDRECHNGDMRVVGRTSRLITFGSPLDKTAFLFRSQVSRDHHYREALAGLTQPLVLDYALRPLGTFEWVNIFSLADVVSGHLIYYDLPAGTHVPLHSAASNPVRNEMAPEAWVPLYAHVQYWSGKTLRDEMWKAILNA